MTVVDSRSSSNGWSERMSAWRTSSSTSSPIRCELLSDICTWQHLPLLFCSFCNRMNSILLRNPRVTTLLGVNTKLSGWGKSIDCPTRALDCSQSNALSCFCKRKNRNWMEGGLKIANPKPNRNSVNEPPVQVCWISIRVSILMEMMKHQHCIDACPVGAKRLSALCIVQLLKQ